MSALPYLRIFGYMSTIILHVTNIAYMVSKHDMKSHEDENIRMFGSLQFRYFTCWNFGLQLVYAVAGLCCDVLTLKNSKKKNYQLPKLLRGFRDTLFSGVLWPSTFFVFSLFWPMFLYDRELVLPAWADKVLTRTSNHIIHTAIVPIVLWEVLLRPRKVPTSHKRNLNHLVLHMLIYLIVLLYTYYERGVWIYPVFNLLYGTIYFPIVIAALIGLAVTFYNMQWVIVRLLFDQESTRKTRTKIT